jgi:anti-sigma regulatory factor (Ser/Thr protein kinase)
MEKKFKRNIKSLNQIFNFIAEFITSNNIDETISFTINLVVEELFTNMVKYNLENSNDILITLDKDQDNLIISLIDFDVEPFDVTKTEGVNISKSLKERKIGGLGLHLVKQMVDKINYEYKNGNSKITLIKQLEK